MFEMFYVVYLPNGRYRLHIKDTHYCLCATEDINTVYKTIERIVKDYKIKEKLMRKIAALSDSGVLSEKTLKTFIEEKDLYGISEHSTIYREIKDTIKRAREEVKNDSIYMRVKRLRNKRRITV